MIKKREHNPQLSVFSNFLLDLVDFKDRVVPLAKDISLLDVTKGYQKQNIKEILEEQEAFMKEMDNVENIMQTGELEENEEPKELEDFDRK